MGNSMAKRKSSKRTRRTTKNLNLSTLAESAIIGSALTKMVFGVNLASFATGVTSGSASGTGFFPNQDGATRITLPELLGINAAGKWSASRVGGTYGEGNTFTSSVMANVRANAFQSVAVALITPMAFRLVRKTFRKPLGIVRKGLKGTGVTV